MKERNQPMTKKFRIMSIISAAARIAAGCVVGLSTGDGVVFSIFAYLILLSGLADLAALLGTKPSEE